jgi:predicted small lipoprotein YifL
LLSQTALPDPAAVYSINNVSRTSLRIRKLVLAVMMLVCVLSVAACGKKPPHVDPPSDVEDDAFPQVYPDPKSNK